MPMRVGKALSMTVPAGVAMFVAMDCIQWVTPNTVPKMKSSNPTGNSIEASERSRR